MSHPDLAADRRAAAAVVGHHTELATALDRHVRALLDAATTGSAQHAQAARATLAAWLQDELLPHAFAEEATLYPVAAAQPGGDLLVTGMLGEHRAIASLVAELGDAGTPVTAAAAARALQAVFTIHLAKENELVVPMLARATDVSLAGLLDGMHDIISAQPDIATGSGCGGGEGACGCGDDSGDPGAGAPVLTIGERHV